MMGLDIGIIVWFFFLVIIGLSLLHRMHAMKTGILIVFVYAAVIVGISTAYALILS
jgi:hypothetical protein